MSKSFFESRLARARTRRSTILRRVALAGGAALLLGGCGGAAGVSASAGVPRSSAASMGGVAAAVVTPQLVGSAAQGATLAPAPSAQRVHALLINGGANAANNQWSHVEHIEGMVDVLSARGVPLERISIFSADGLDSDSDVIRRAVRAETAGSWLLEGTELGEALEPRRRLVDTEWGRLLDAELAARVEPARKETLRAWFEGAAKTLVPGDTLLLYATDHGLKGRNGELDNGSLALWGEELDVREMRQMLDLLDPRVRVVLMMSQCYSGTFAAALLPPGTQGAADDGVQACGLFSVPADLPAFGCFPEGRARGELGHGYALIRALETQTRLDDAHRVVTRDDMTPDVPVRTSDVLVERVLGELAGARQQSLVQFVDTQVAASRERSSQRAAWSSLGEVAAAHGLDVPRDLASLEALDEELASTRDKLKNLHTYWLDTLGGLAEANLVRFLERHPKWRDRLDPRALEPLEGRELEALHAELAAALERDSREHAARLYGDLEHFYAQTAAAEEATWRAKVRLAGGQRLRVALLDIAAREALAQPGHDALARSMSQLQACEAFAPGLAPGASADRPQTPAPLVALADDRALLERLRPARLGVSFSPVEGFAAGAVRVREVSPRSSAARAGLQEGDVVLGPPQAPFELDIDLRRWVLSAPRNQPLELVVMRGNDQHTVTVELE